MRRFIINLLLTSFIGIIMGLSLKEKEIRKENEKLKEDIKQNIWVRSAKEVQPQNNLVSMGANNDKK